MSSRTFARLRNVCGDERGNVAILFALSILPVVGAIGVSVDYSRALRLKTQLQAVADGATMAGLNEYRNTGDLQKGQQRLLAFIDEGLEKDGMVRARELEEGESGRLGGRVVFVDAAVIDPSTSSVRPVLSTSIETPFMSIIGVNELDVSVFTGGAVAGSTTQGTKDLELSLMLDVSGSMAGQKVIDMKAAANDFLDIVMPSDLAANNRRVGVVPFSERVNVGSYASAATGLAPTAQIQTGTTTQNVFSTSSFSWLQKSSCGDRVQQATAYANYSQSQAEQYCVNNFSRRTNRGKTEYSTPAVNSVQVPVYATRKLRTCVTERQGSHAYTDEGARSGSYVGSYDPDSGVSGQYSSSGGCSLPVIKALTTDKQALKNHINTFGTYNGTAGHTATAWSWYMLAPEWRSFWGADVPDVASYSDTNTIKAAVLMTDGEYNSNWANPSASQQAVSLCTAMKEKGITVYTIGFDMSTNPANVARQTLISCASPGKYYFPYNGEELRQAFEQIGNSLVTIVTRSTDDRTVLIQE